MIRRYPWLIILIGFLLVLLGFVVPFLMVIGILPSTFALNFFSYAASISGLVLGLVGLAWNMRTSRK